MYTSWQCFTDVCIYFFGIGHFQVAQFFQSEVKNKNFDIKIEWLKTYFHMKAFALGLALAKVIGKLLIAEKLTTIIIVDNNSLDRSLQCLLDDSASNTEKSSQAINKETGWLSQQSK